MRDLLHSALGALLITAACGGSETPPGGGNGNGDTDGGGNGTTDGHVPDPSNPLIEIIPGNWTHCERDGQEPDNQGGSGVFVDPDDPDCGQRCSDLIPPSSCPVGPPGDACISFWPTPRPGEGCRELILEGSAVRARDYHPWTCSGCLPDTLPEECVYRCTNCDILGEVLDNGTRVVFTITTTEVGLAVGDGEGITCGGDADCPSGTGTCQDGYCVELLGTETHVDMFREDPNPDNFVGPCDEP